MPHIWARFPEAELWLIGSQPPMNLMQLGNPRVKVTGFVPRVQDILATMSVVICPWWGAYGFRSRVIEVMALGVPIVTTSDAVEGMDLVDGNGILVRPEASQLCEAALGLLESRSAAQRQSTLARAEIEAKYALESTYGELRDALARVMSTSSSLGRRVSVDDR